MSDLMSGQSPAEELPPIRELSKPQRRVLGTLIEKALTVPESYPMTLKGLTVGCNQKSNRDPVTSYAEDAALLALDELRAKGLVTVIHTESGRTERYRHHARKRFPFSEPQLAIITELLLRGRQQLGELRSRASRMVPIESLESLRQELEGLMQQGYVFASGPLDRRGIEIDHCFYLASEGQTQPNSSNASSERERADFPVRAVSSQPTPETASPSSASNLQTQFNELRELQRELQSELEELRQQLADVQENVTDLRQSLGA